MGRTTSTATFDLNEEDLGTVDTLLDFELGLGEREIFKRSIFGTGDDRLNDSGSSLYWDASRLDPEKMGLGLGREADRGVGDDGGGEDEGRRDSLKSGGSSEIGG